MDLIGESTFGKSARRCPGFVSRGQGLPWELQGTLPSPCALEQATAECGGHPPFPPTGGGGEGGQRPKKSLCT